MLYPVSGISKPVPCQEDMFMNMFLNEGSRLQNNMESVSVLYKFCLYDFCFSSRTPLWILSDDNTLLLPQD